MRKFALVLICTLPLAACAGTWQRLTPVLLPKGQPTRLQQLTTGGKSAAAMDGATAAQISAARAAPQTGQLLGMVSVALGSPSDQGLWLKSNLVQSPAKGRVVLATGQGVNVDLRPSTGAATLSLSAYRALGLKLTDLPQVQVMALP